MENTVAMNPQPRAHRCNDYLPHVVEILVGGDRAKSRKNSDTTNHDEKNANDRPIHQFVQLTELGRGIERVLY